MRRVHRASFIAPHDPYVLRKRFRHETDPRKTSRWRLIYNENEGSILGRTPLNWCQLLIFYIIFFVSIALLCWICWIGFVPTLSDNKPTVLMTQPGLAMQPIISAFFELHYELNDDAIIDQYVKKIDVMLSKYGRLPDGYFAECKAADDYGFRAGTPCIFLKINRIIGFKVEPYEDAAQLPKEAPDQLRQVVNGLPAEQRKDRVWVSCEAEGMKRNQPKFVYQPSQWVLAAAVNLKEKVSYANGFYNKEDYQRVVAVKISGFPHGQKIRLFCYIWAKNIHRDAYSVMGETGLGVVRFSINIG